MKKLITVTVCVTIAISIFAAFAADVPAVVKTAFAKKYPNITKVKWDKENENYEASFDLNKVDCSVLFDANGNIIETEVEIELNELPKGVLDYVKARYAGKKAKEAAKITDAKGNVTYEVELKGMDVLFDSEGKFIKEVKD